MASETTRLSSASTTYRNHGRGAVEANRPSFSLHDRSTSLLVWAKDFVSKTPPGTVPLRQPDRRDPSAELVTSLYASYLLSLPPPSGLSIRAALSNTVIGRKVQAYLYDAIEDMLDAGGSIFSDGIDHGEEGEAEWMIWKLWPIRHDPEEEVCVLDLLLPPYVPWSRSSPFLSHPLIRHIIEHTWVHGVPRPQEGPESTSSRLRYRLKNSITPFRAHFLHFVSFSVLFGLSIALVIRPSGRLSPNPPEIGSSSLSPTEIIWIIWTSASFANTVQRSTTLIRPILLLPTHLALFLTAFDPLTAYSSLTISIPTLTTLLVLPIFPSVPLLFQSLIPLSALLLDMLLRSARSATLLMPLVLGLLLLFAWSMNGDIFRGFFSSSSLLQARKAVQPVEAGIAPFQARLWIFVTVLVLVLFSITLSIARAIMPVREGWDENDYRRWKGGVKEGDDWEREYGVTVARLARRRLGLAVRELVRPLMSPIETSRSDEEVRGERLTPDVSHTGNRTTPRSKAVMMPFNLLCSPLDIALALVNLGNRLGFTSTGGELEILLRGIRGWMALVIMGLPCYFLGLAERLLGRTYATQ